MKYIKTYEARKKKLPKFSIGQKVVFMDVREERDKTWGLKFLKHGNIYEIEKIAGPNEYNEYEYKLKDIGDSETYFYESDFTERLPKFKVGDIVVFISKDERSGTYWVKPFLMQRLEIGHKYKIEKIETPSIHNYYFYRIKLEGINEYFWESSFISELEYDAKYYNL